MKPSKEEIEKLWRFRGEAEGSAQVWMDRLAEIALNDRARAWRYWRYLVCHQKYQVRATVSQMIEQFGRPPLDRVRASVRASVHDRVAQVKSDQRVLGQIPFELTIASTNGTAWAFQIGDLSFFGPVYEQRFWATELVTEGTDTDEWAHRQIEEVIAMIEEAEEIDRWMESQN